MHNANVFMNVAAIYIYKQNKKRTCRQSLLSFKDVKENKLLVNLIH